MSVLRRVWRWWLAAWGRGSLWLIALLVLLAAWNAALGAWLIVGFDVFFVGLLVGYRTYRPTPPPASTSTAEAMAQVMDQVQQFEEAARGYRATLERQGWSPTAAEAMALQLHAGLVASAFTPRRG